MPLYKYNLVAKSPTLNQSAHDLFKLGGKSTNLENLARCTQPSKLFLNLCAKEGQTTFSLNGRLVEGISSAVPVAHKKPEILVSLIQPSLDAGQHIQLSQPPHSRG